MSKKFLNGLNRFNYKEIARQIGSQKGYERPEDTKIEQPGQPSQQIIVQQNIKDKEEIIYIPKKGDHHFDYVGRFAFTLIGLPNWLAFAAGAEWTIFRAIIPNGQNAIIQKYCFWTVVDETPAIPYPVLASPVEFFNDFHYRLTINRNLPLDQRAWVATPAAFANPNANNYTDGCYINSQDPERDSNPNSGGINIIAPGGSDIQVRCIKISAAATPFIYGRVPLQFFCRLRGFLTTESVRR